MTTKNVVVLAGAAVALGVAAFCMNGSSKTTGAKLNGRKVVPEFNVSEVARIEAGSLKLAAGTNGWVVESYFGYPADRSKIADAMIKLSELKVGQVASGRELGTETKVTLKDAAGKDLVALQLGDKHAKWGHGRYAKFEGETVLVSDTLDDFGGDAKAWCETKIVDEPWISFNEVIDPKTDAAKFGFATGIVAKVTVAGDTNRTITVGAPVKEGGDRYVKLDGSDWVYAVSSYSVEKFLPKPEPKEEKKPEPKEEKKK